MRMTTPITEVCMRGDDREDQKAMWSYVPMERRIPADHPLRAARDAAAGRCPPARPLATVRRALLARRPALDCPREIAAGPAAAGAVHDPERAAADGAAGL